VFYQLKSRRRGATLRGFPIVGPRSQHETDLDDTSANEGSLNAILDEIPIGIAIAAGPDVRIRAISRYARK
jgi:hypothetical protein